MLIISFKRVVENFIFTHNHKLILDFALFQKQKQKGRVTTYTFANMKNTCI